MRARVKENHTYTLTHENANINASDLDEYISVDFKRFIVKQVSLQDPAHTNLFIIRTQMFPR